MLVAFHKRTQKQRPVCSNSLKKKIHPTMICVAVDCWMSVYTLRKQIKF